MKKVLLFALSLLCVCSCEKGTSDDASKLIIGSWEVSIIAQYEGKTDDYGTCNFTFLENGKCIYFWLDNTSNRGEFAYYYDKGNNAIVLDEGNETTLLKIESISKDRFVLHSDRRSGGYVTYNGKKIK